MLPKGTLRKIESADCSWNTVSSRIKKMLHIVCILP